MKAYPQTIHFIGLNTPIGTEYDLADLPVEGTIPADVDGVFFRAVPDPAFPPKFDDDNLLSHDGMISAVRLQGGKARMSMRYVKTARYLAEQEKGRARFGRYRNPFTDDDDVKGIDRTVANTTPVWHAGRLLMTKEDGRPYRIDPQTLATLGSYDFGGKLKSDTVTAHVRVDPVTGEMFFFGYEADGPASTKIAYMIADKDGTLVKEQWFDAPYCAMMHDFTITENYALFPIYPTTSDLDRLKQGGEHWIHEMERDSWLGIMPRYGDVSEVRWFKGPKGVSCYHMMGAFEDADGVIHFDQCLSNVNAFPFIREASGIHMAPQEVQGALTRWSVDPKGDATEVRETIIGPPGDFPVIPAARQGRPYDHGWMLTMNPEMQGPPVFGGPVGAMFNMLLRLDFRGGPMQALPLGPGMSYNEPVHVPSATPGHEGWLLMIVDTQIGEADFIHACWIIEAGNVGAGPVAKIGIPHRLRPQVHGWWVSSDQLAKAVA